MSLASENGMDREQSSNRRIAKNTLALYFRMVITMLVGLYTSRVILKALGIEDYGIYNVVGGFVSMFSLISGSMQGAVGRFLTYELGLGNMQKLKAVFSTSFYVMLGLSILIFVFTETFGLWYLFNKLVIPINRFNAALWCFQLSMVSFVMSLMNTPYTSSIIAHEKMSIYAYISIIDAILKLIICFFVMHFQKDKLVLYSFLLCCVGIIDILVYVAYCRCKFYECKLSLCFDKLLFRQMFGFAGWNFVGSSAAVLRNQGANLLLNAFGGPVVNAANGIANTICGVVSGFVGNFTQAFNPQITKRYATKEYESLMSLVIYGSKYSFYLMLIMALPVLFNAKYIFYIWLGVVPEHAVTFSRWMFVFLLAEAISRPIITVKNATGQIRNYQLVVGGILLLMLPVSYVGLKLGMPVTFVAVVNALTAILAIFARMYMLRGDFPYWSSRRYFKEVLLNAFYVSALSCLAPAILYKLLPEGLLNFLLTSVFCLISSCVSMFYCGCTKKERDFIKNKVQLLLTKIKIMSDGSSFE